jgi:hypothetical protein
VNLLPCPFCGAPAALNRRDVFTLPQTCDDVTAPLSALPVPDAEHAAQVECTLCGCTTPLYFPIASFDGVRVRCDAGDRAVATWNQRA